MKKKFLSIILLAAMLISVILISPIYVSADTVTIGRDIDSWAQGYIDEVNNQQTYNCVVSLSEESGCVKSGKSLKFTFKSDGNARFVNDYWLPSNSADGYMGMKFWVYNPGENEVHMGLRLANDQNYSLKRSAAYILEYEDGNTVSKSTVFDHSAKDTNLNQYGEMQIPAGFKGTVYIPFDSLYTKPASVGKYRLDFYTDDGTIYFDEFKLYNEDVNVNIINDFEEDIKIDYSDNSEISLSNEEAFSGKSLKLTVPNARVSTSIIYGNSAVSVDKFSNIRMYVVNNHADAYLSFRFEGMSLRTGDKYYTVDINS